MFNCILQPPKNKYSKYIIFPENGKNISPLGCSLTFMFQLLLTFMIMALYHLIASFYVFAHNLTIQIPRDTMYPDIQKKIII